MKGLIMKKMPAISLNTVFALVVSWLLLGSGVSFAGNLNVTQDKVEIDKADISETLTAASAVIQSLTVNGETTGTPKIKVGLATRHMTEPTGLQAITGVGFQPKALIVILVRNDHAEMAVGFSDGQTSKTFWDRHNAVANTWNTSNGLGLLYETGGRYYSCNLHSFDTDGFTLNWVRTGDKNGILQIIYMVIG